MSRINNVGGSGGGGGLADAARALLNFFRGRSTRATQANEQNAIPQRTHTTRTQSTRSNQPASLSERDIGHGTSKKRRSLADAVRAILNFFRGRSAPRPNEPTSPSAQATAIRNLAPGGQSDRSTLKIDSSSISETEVAAIMPHLLSPGLELNNKLAGSTTGDLMPAKIKADILQAKMDSTAELKGLSSSENDLTKDELQALRNYMGSSAINKKLRADGVKKLRGNDKHQYKQMMSGLNKLSNYEGIVYRSASMSPANIENFKNSVGGVVSSKAFISTSISPNMSPNVSKASSDGGVSSDNTGAIKLRFQMIQHSGKNISGVDDALEMKNDPNFKPDINLYDGTGEILIKPNALFRLVALEKHPSDNIYGAILKEVDSPKPSDNVGDRQDVSLEQAPAAAKDSTDEFVEIIGDEQSTVDDSFGKREHTIQTDL